MPFRELRSRCGCGGQLVQDTSNYEVVCSACGLVADWDDVAKPMNPPKSDFKKSLAPHIEDAPRVERRKKQLSKKHAGGRRRTRPYMRLRSFMLSKKRAKRVKPVKLTPTSKVAQVLREIARRAIKHALFDYYEEKGLRWRGKNRPFLRCPEHGEFHDAVSATCTVVVKNPRVRIPLPCGYRLDLKMWCPFCGWQIKPSKNFFQCSNPRGPKYPERCFCFPMDKVEEVVKLEFGE